MRDLIEIASQLDEYQKIANPAAMDVNKLEVVDRMTMSSEIGTVDVAERHTPIMYSVVAIKDGKVLAALDFEPFSGGRHYMLKHAVAFIPQKGLATSLFQWVNKTYKWGVFSDTKMTDEGEAFWKSLMKKFGGKVVNLESGETFSLTQIDGRFVIDPKDDNSSDDMFFKDPVDGQKWFYLIETRSTKPIIPKNPTRFGYPLKGPYSKGHGLRREFPLHESLGFLVPGYD